MRGKCAILGNSRAVSSGLAAILDNMCNFRIRGKHESGRASDHDRKAPAAERKSIKQRVHAANLSNYAPCGLIEASPKNRLGYCARMSVMIALPARKTPTSTLSQPCRS